MKILVANLGSTSFKYRLFDMDTQRQLARGGIERIGVESSRCFVEVGVRRREETARVADQAEAVGRCLTQLTDPELGCLAEATEVSAIALKAVHGGTATGVRRVTPEVLAAMEEIAPAAPAHNPPYIAAMRQLAERLPEIPLVVAFETDFHETIPERNRHYAVPHEWIDAGLVRRWGFHGASHRYIATRTAELLGADDPGSRRCGEGGCHAHASRGHVETASESPHAHGKRGHGTHCEDSPQHELRIISCHLGGSSSLCAIRGGRSMATSMGFSPQSGLPQGNRVGDFDPFALPVIMRQTGQSLDEALDALAHRGGLAGLSGTSGDIRDVAEAADAGSRRARLALDVYVGSIRHYLGAYLVELGGADAIVFTGGIGENRPALRAAVCENLGELGIVLDSQLNETARGEVRISAAESRVGIWVVPTNEELIVARQAAQLLEG